MAIAIFLRQKDSEPSLVSRKRLSRREFARWLNATVPQAKPQTSPRARVARTRFLKTFCPAKKIRDGNRHPLSFWQGQKDSNPRPMVLETSTLPTELYPCVHFCNAQYYIIVLSKLQVFFQKNFIFFSKKRNSASQKAEFLFIVSYQVSNTRLTFTLLTPLPKAPRRLLVASVWVRRS